MSKALSPVRLVGGYILGSLSSWEGGGDAFVRLVFHYVVTMVNGSSFTTEGSFLEPRDETDGRERRNQETTA